MKTLGVRSVLTLENLIELSSELLSDETELDLLELVELDEREDVRLDSLEMLFESKEDYSYPDRNDDSELGFASEPDPLSSRSEFLAIGGASESDPLSSRSEFLATGGGISFFSRFFYCFLSFLPFFCFFDSFCKSSFGFFDSFYRSSCGFVYFGFYWEITAGTSTVYSDS